VINVGVKVTITDVNGTRKFGNLKSAPNPGIINSKMPS